MSEAIKSLGLDKNLTRVITILIIGGGLTAAAINYQQAILNNKAEEIKQWANSNFQSKVEATESERRFTAFLLSAAAKVDRR